MSAGYSAVSWTPHKRIYDAVLAVGVVAYLALFVGVGQISHPQTTVETLLIRGLGTGAFLLLHVILCIGPLARLDRRFLPLLYNRRHLGVTMAALALGHGTFALVQFHGLGVVHPLVSVLTSNGDYDSLHQFPFQALGLVALVVVLLMAATSHDFWLTNLTAPVWKALHMLVYAAYGLLVAHVALGVLQDERGLLPAAVLWAGVLLVCALHLAAAFHDPVEAALLVARPAGDWVDVGSVDAMPLDRGRIVELSGERVALFRYRDGDVERIAAVSNVCQHQNGPLGEGRVVDGCITCPWHGFQYRPADGASPPPFTERIPTFRVRLEGDRVLVHPLPLDPGTDSRPPAVAGAHRAAADAGGPA